MFRAKPLQALFVSTVSMLAAVPALSANPTTTHKFTISNVVCKYLACEPEERSQGQDTLEVQGEDFQKWAGNNLRFRVYRLIDKGHGDVVIDRQVGVTPNGYLATSVPVYNLTDGNYYLAFYSAEAPGKPVAVGIFTRTTEEAASQQGQDDGNPDQAQQPDQKASQ